MRITHRSIASRMPAMVAMMSLLATGCGDTPATKTGPASQPVILGIVPAEGLAGSPVPVEIHGSGFLPGATVRFGSAYSAATVSASLIRVTAPPRTEGVVDVIVTNPDGASVTRPDGFAYRSAVVTFSPNPLAAGESMTVNWYAAGRSIPAFQGDWLGIFRYGDPDDATPVWAKETTGVSGMMTLNAPNEPGEYELRYMLGDELHHYIAIARAGPITVTRN